MIDLYSPIREISKWQTSEPINAMHHETMIIDRMINGALLMYRNRRKEKESQKKRGANEKSGKNVSIFLFLMAHVRLLRPMTPRM